MSKSSKAGDMILKLSPELMYEDTSDSLSSFADISSIPQSLPADNDTQDYQPLEANLSSVGNNFQSASDGGGAGMAGHTPSTQSGHSNQPSNHHNSRPSNHKARWIILAILTLLLLGLALLWYRASTQASQLRSAQSELQEALESSEKLQAKEVQVLADKIAKLRTELDEDIPQDIQAQYNKLLTQLQTLSKSSNSAVASLSTQLVAQLTNQAGEGIGLSSDGKTITNKGVLSVNSQSGDINIQGTPNQTTVTQNGSNITLGTSQDIASTASPTFNNQTLTGNQTVSGNTTTNGLTIQSSGTQNGYALCDASNNCGYSGAGSSYVQGGNSFGNPANLGTNDNQALNLRTNGTTRLTVDTAGNTSLTGNLSTPGSVSAGSLAGNGSGVTNVDALTLQGNGASYYTNASNLASGTLSDARLSSNIPLKNATNTFTGTNNFAGLTATGILQGGYSVCDTSNNCNYAPISGSSNYIWNGTSPQTANINIQSANSTNIGLVVQGASGQTANLQEWRNSSNTVLSYINNTGALSINSSVPLAANTKLKVNGGTMVANNSESGWVLNGVTNGTQLFTSEPLGSGSPSVMALSGNINGYVISPLGSWGSIGSFSLSRASWTRVVIGARNIAVSAGPGSSDVIYGGQGIATFEGPGLSGSTSVGSGLYGEVNTNQPIATVARKGYGVRGVANSDVGAIAFGGHFRANGAGINTALQAEAGTASTLGLVIKGYNAQTGDLLQAQDSTGAVLAKIDASGNLTVKNANVEGAYITFSNNIRGYNVAVSASATSQVVTFGTAHPDANYAVFCTPDWNTTCFVTNKTTTGFTLNYGTSAPSSQLVDWFVAR